MHEYLSPDILDEEFIKIFSPLLITQKILGSCRVDMRHRFVTPPSVCQKISSVIILILQSITMITLRDFLAQLDNAPKLYYIFCLVAPLMYTVTAFCGIIHVRLLNGDDNTNFFIELQKNDRVLKLRQNKFIYRIVRRYIIILCIFCWISIIIGIIISQFHDCYWCYSVLYSMSILVAEMLLCIVIILNLLVRLIFVNCIIINYIEGNPFRPNPGLGNLPTKTLMVYAASLTHSFESDETGVFLQGLLDSYSKLRVLFQFHVFISCFKFIPLSQMGFYFLFVGVQPTGISTFLFPNVSAYTMILVDLHIIIIMSIICDIFHNELLTTKRLCINVMALHQEGPLREKAKNMLYRLKQKPYKFNVYSMWTMEGYTIFNIIKTCTTLVITMLQFLYL